MDRSKWFPDYWGDRPRIDDDGNEIPETSSKLLIDENGVLEEFQEITGLESHQSAVEERDVEVDQYADDWNSLSSELKNQRGWRCELCGFVSVGSSAIHTHHVDHDKKDNSVANLQVLCLICHGKKHGSGAGMGGCVVASDLAELEAWHRGSYARERLKNNTRKTR